MGAYRRRPASRSSPPCPRLRPCSSAPRPPSSSPPRRPPKRGGSCSPPQTRSGKRCRGPSPRRRRRAAALVEELGAATRRIERLAGMLWEAVPGQGRAPWFPQRYMLERLEEELARAQRHGGPLSVVLGEVRPGGACSSAEQDRV